MSKGATDQTRTERVLEGMRGTMEAIERRDRETARRLVAELWHEDCEWSPLIAGVEGESSYQGREGVVAFFDDFTNTFEVNYRDPEFTQIGNAVVFMSTMDLRGRESGVEVERELGALYEFDGDLIRRGRAYDSHAAAIAAAEELDAKT